MLPVLCDNKSLAVASIIVIISSSWIKFSHQQQHLQSEYPFDELNQFELLDQNNRNIQSGLSNKYWLSPGQELIFATTTTTSKPLEDSVVFVNNQPAVPTMVPFISAATTSTPEFLDCLRKCPTTSEFNPICASNRQQYGNEQKFICAQQCGADIEIVRRGSCEGLFPMARG